MSRERRWPQVLHPILPLLCFLNLLCRRTKILQAHCLVNGLWQVGTHRKPCRFLCAARDPLQPEPTVVNDYSEAFETLLAAKDVSTAEFRSTFRRLASVMHPDVAGDSPEVADRFQALLSAYKAVEEGRTREDQLVLIEEDELPSWLRGVPSQPAKPEYVSTTDEFDGRRRDRCFPGDVVLFRLRDDDIEKFELADRCSWGLAVISCDDGGFIHAQRLVFEDESSRDDRYRSGWLVTDDYEEEVLIDPMSEIEVLPTKGDAGSQRFTLALPVDTSYVFASYWGWET
eukprot:TRINITY_DN55436_c0_g1_i1.p1 TRINITY_DN55436_c0_g1~~TRINITY_DN55436_c0_g1_i1.p1  ORF type:complete len:286 (+),score=24.05 TRINITY_DN55436_c0_g1_i1:84-941(+)